MTDTTASDKKATLALNGQTYDLPILKGSTGPDVVDVRALYANADVFTFDPGFTSTASCESKITYIDGDKGILLHRGYSIEELAEKSSFLEVCYLLLNGELPTAGEFEAFEHNITYHTMLHSQFDRFFTGFRSDAHPMAIMTGAVGALSAFYHDSTNVNDPKQREISAHRLIAKMPTIAARAFKYSVGQPFVSPRNELSFAENFLRMSFSVPAEDWVPNPVLTRAMDRIFILHADHEQNASTSTVRLAGSSGANPFACIAAGIACLWGPAHGGANEEALNMLMEIGTVDRIPEYVQGDLFQLHRHLQQRIVAVADLGQDFVAGLLHHRRARVIVLIDPVAEAHQPVFAILHALDVFGDAIDSADFHQHVQRLFVGAPMRGTPQAGDAGRDTGKRVGARGAGQTDGRGRGVLFVVGVQDEDTVHGTGQHRVRHPVLGRDAERHAQEVFSEAQLVARGHEGLADRIFERPGGDGWHLGDQPMGRNLALLRIVDVGAVMIKRRQGADRAGHDRHRVGVAAEAGEEAVELRVQHGVVGDGRLKFCEFGRVG